MKPPPHTQHMTLAVKSSSSSYMENMDSHMYAYNSKYAQPIIILFLAPLSVSVQGEGGEGGEGGRKGGVGKRGGGGREGRGGGWSREPDSPLSRQPDAQQDTRQHSSSSHTPSEHH